MLAAIDPNTKRLAYVIGEANAKRGGYLIGELPIGDADQARRLVGFAQGLRAMGVTTVAYEAPYLGVNPKTFGVLSALMGAVEGSMIAQGLNFVKVLPTQWQAACLSLGRGGSPKTREEIKPLSVIYATDVLGMHPGSEDLADATCLHRYASTHDTGVA